MKTMKDYHDLHLKTLSGLIQLLVTESFGLTSKFIMSQPEKQRLAINIWPNISRSKRFNYKNQN